MLAIAIICTEAQDGCQCIACRHARLKNKLTGVRHVVQWFRSVLEELEQKTELDPYQRGFRDAVRQVLNDVEEHLGPEADEDKPDE